MSEIPDTEKARSRRKHIFEWRDGALARGHLHQCIVHIQNNTGSRAGCLSTLKSYSEVFAMAAWYERGDLVSFKSWMYSRAKLEYILTSPPFDETGGKIAFEYRAIHGLFALVSDHDGLIDWYSRLDNLFDARRVENPNAFDFWTKQFFVALRGEWATLIERCERIIENPPNISRSKKFLIDHRFYMALARGDVKGMEAIIEELVSPSLIARRISLEGGFRADLICTMAVIYTKLAWRHGYRIVVNSPYIPRDWLPVAPLPEYIDPFDFMRKYEIGK